MALRNEWSLSTLRHVTAACASYKSHSQTADDLRRISTALRVDMNQLLHGMWMDHSHYQLLEREYEAITGRLAVFAVPVRAQTPPLAVGDADVDMDALGEEDDSVPSSFSDSLSTVSAASAATV